MCRLVAVRDSRPFDVAEVLRPFAVIARNSREFQGDGWGFARWNGGEWDLHRSILPIWEDRLDAFGRARVLVAHARSAFRNEGISIENNMPFLDGRWAFAFNGELRGVRLREEGRIGAEKLLRFLLRMGAGSSAAALRRGVAAVGRRTAYVRAMNFVLASPTTIRLCSQFSEDPGYFTMHSRRAGSRLAVCSEPFNGESGWMPIPNGTVEEVA